MKKVTTTLSLLLACTAMPAFAQSTGDLSADTPAPEPADGGDIIVTATRQSQSLSRVPVSVAAYTQERMDKQGVKNIDDVVRLTRGLSQTPIGSNDVSGMNKTISIRGISSNVGSATTGIYIDDTPIQTRAIGNVSSNVYPQVFDLSRVEVLRGPQGTLFGAGAEGGVVRFITPTPDLAEMDMYGRAELATTEGGAPSYEAGAAVGLPVVEDTLGIRLSGWYRRDGGFVDRVWSGTGDIADKNANDIDNYVLRGSAKLQASDRLSAVASLYYQKVYAHDAATYFAQYSDPDANDFAAARGIPTTADDRFYLPSLNLEYEGDGFDLISTTSMFDRKVDRVVDYSIFVGSLMLGDPYAYQPGEDSVAYINDAQRDFTQELRIQSNDDGPISWVLGGFYSHSKQTTYQYNDERYYPAAAERLGLTPLPLLDDIALYTTTAKSVDEQLAAFGQVDYEVVENLKLTAGLRIAKVKSRFERASDGPVAGEGGTFTGSQSESPVTPKFGASWQIDPATLLYASAAKGYRIGGVNGSQSSLCADALASIGLDEQPQTYNSDTLWSYEAGFKRSSAGFSIEASAFDIHWNDIQRQVVLPTCGASFVANFGGAQSTGFDVQLQYSLSGNFSVGGSLGYADARLTEDVISEASGITTVYGRKGDKIGGAPWTWALFGQYDMAITDDKDMYLRMDYQHVGQGADINYEVYGVDPIIEPSEAYDLIALRAGVTAGAVDLSVFVNNLLNQHPVLYRMRYSTAFDNFWQESTLRPRTFGLTATYRY